MSSPEPRRDAPSGDAAPDASSNGGAGSGGAVLVADSVEAALAAVQVQLARQAATTLPPEPPPPVAAPAPVILAPPVPLAPAPPPPAPVVAPAPEAPVRARRRPAPAYDDDELYEDDDETLEFWGETRPRTRTEKRVDPSDLTSAERRALGRLRARKVRRILRHVSPWSVFKVSIFFNLCLWLILMVAGVILWKVAQQTPVLENIEKFYAKATGEKSFELDGRALFRAAAGAGIILVLSGTAFIVLLSVLFNLIADLTGGIRMSVIELESTRRTVRRTRGANDLRARARVDDELDEADGEPAKAVSKGKGKAGGDADTSDDGDSAESAAAADAPTLVSERSGTNLAAFERVRAVQVDASDGGPASGSGSSSGNGSDGGAGAAAEPKVLARAAGDEDPPSPS